MLAKNLAGILQQKYMRWKEGEHISVETSQAENYGLNYK